MNKSFEKILELIEQNTLKNRDSISFFNECGINFISTGKAKEIVQKVEREYNGGWIPCSESLPNDCDNRFYMCIVENHEEDLPMFCQYEEELGFGFWQDIYDEHTLGFVDSIFNTNEELGYEKVIAWMPLPKPYKESD